MHPVRLSLPQSRHGGGMGRRPLDNSDNAWHCVRSCFFFHSQHPGDCSPGVQARPKLPDDRRSPSWRNASYEKQ
eukprot:3426396-Pyramimonas_sp.AAC.1